VPDPISPGGPGAQAAEEMTFEELMTALEEVTDRLASGELGIEAAADLYEQAERLHALAAQRLAQVQERVDRLAQHGRLDAGGPVPPTASQIP
jgi:exodeoxyribonuclease VII small subunit